MNDYLIKTKGNDWYNKIPTIQNNLLNKVNITNKSTGKIVSDLSFGTWTTILEYYKNKKDYNFYKNIFNTQYTTNIKQPNKFVDTQYGYCQQNQRIKK